MIDERHIGTFACGAPLCSSLIDEVHEINRK